MRNKILAALLVCASIPALAVNSSISKSASPGTVTVTSSGRTTSSFFGILNGDFASGTYNKPKKLTGITWTSTSYPTVTTETVSLCYFTPYNLTSPAMCIPIQANASGSTTQFNNLQFGAGAQISIRHDLSAPTQVATPAGRDSIVVNYSY
ncbi:hypothetical protein HQN60_15980 (plasmid) [Deefgea piscis]|uniref:Uncharacterized protein n=1 Tax=Deefgea piscis TaxID=2739061 RepID=A0A6M8T2U8_9NEIS|nr:hypothetical protein [Deefgea piscis]QKJ68307.1 hypothetical protein HQN60_15980 [Deefgea piscis]